MTHFLSSIPHALLVLVVAGLVGVESIGLPLPGETVLISALLIGHDDGVSPVWLFLAAAVGAIVGDNIGYAIGRFAGVPLLDWLRRHLPRVFRTEGILAAARVMSRFGGWAVFASRFVAVLRMLAGPLAGALRMHYRTFFVANAAGALTWSGVITLAVTLAGAGARDLVHRASWVLLVIAAVAVVAFIVAVVVRRRHRAKHPQPVLTPAQAALPLKTLLAQAAAEGRAACRRRGPSRAGA